jgi:catechol 2,3-dioxygenase-like lactoylglutathione lyase family enzyme
MDLERIDHVAVVVHDLDQSIQFYTEVLGMELDRVLDLPEFKLRVAFVTRAGADIELMDFEDESVPIGVRHICAQVPDVPAAAEELARRGIDIDRPLDRTSLGFWYIMIRDPNGVVIEFLDSSHKEVPGAWRPGNQKGARDK